MGRKGVYHKSSWSGESQTPEQGRIQLEKASIKWNELISSHIWFWKAHHTSDKRAIVGTIKLTIATGVQIRMSILPISFGLFQSYCYKDIEQLLMLLKVPNPERIKFLQLFRHNISSIIILPTIIDTTGDKTLFY